MKHPPRSVSRCIDRAGNDVVASFYLLAGASILVLLSAPAGRAQQTPEGWSYERLYEEGISTARLLEGTRVLGPDGETIGDIANVVISFEGDILSLIAGVGGRWNTGWDIGETFVNVPWEKVEWIAEGAQIPIEVDSLDAYPLFPNVAISARQAGTDVTQVGEEVNPLRAFKATELIGDYARLEDKTYIGYVNDIIFDRSGNLQAVVVVPDPDSPITGGRAYPYQPDPEAFDPSRTYYDIGYTEEEAVLFDQFELQELESERQLSP